MWCIKAWCIRFLLRVYYTERLCIYKVQYNISTWHVHCERSSRVIFFICMNNIHWIFSSVYSIQHLNKLCYIERGFWGPLSTHTYLYGIPSSYNVFLLDLKKANNFGRGWSILTIVKGCPWKGRVMEGEKKFFLWSGRGRRWMRGMEESICNNVTWPLGHVVRHLLVHLLVTSICRLNIDL